MTGTADRARPRSRHHPVLVLAVLCMGVAVALFVVRAGADSVGSTAPVDLPVSELVVVPVAGETPVMSLRRSAVELVQRQGFGQLDTALDGFAARLDARSCVRVAVGDVIAESGRDGIVIPASSLKVLTAAVAIEVLGADHRFTTTVQAPAPVDGVVNGNITLVGGGDPLLSGDWYPSSALDRYPVFNHTSLDALAAQVAASGVQRVTGVVVGDGSRWPEERYNTAWAEGVAGIEAGPIGALLVNDARVEGGAFRYDDPVAAAVIEFERALQRAGIVIDGGAVTADAPASTIADINSAPLRDVITEMLHTSDNNTAEMLLREVGLAAAGAGTTTAGTTVVLDVLAGLGLDTSGIELFDGSGLAPGNRITCDALLTVLATAPDAVVDALAVAGRSGSLIDVYADTEWDGRLRAKTGTLGNPPYDQDPPAVKALVGELLMGDTAESMRFALILNQYQIDDQSRYRPLWGELLNILDTGPDGYTVADLGPR